MVKPNGSNVITHAPLAPLTTLRVGGPADRLVTATTTDELVDAVREVDDADEPLLVLSGGSNVVISDDGFPGTVVQVATSGITVESSDYCGGANVRVAAGESWDEVVSFACTQGWAGVETLAGIPGCTGATPVQNVGAYGADVADTIASVRVWDRRDQAVRTFSNSECQFAYRTSVFKTSKLTAAPAASVWAGGRFVVLDVLFQFDIADLSRPVRYADLASGLGIELGERAPLDDVREAVLEQRRRRGMVLDERDHDTWSCGSFFTNPQLTPDAYDELAQRAADAGVPPRFAGDGDRIKTSAAWLIERAGFGKGFGQPGPAALSTKHVLAVTNRGHATASDIAALAAQVRDGVRERFGVTLENEPVFVGHSL